MRSKTHLVNECCLIRPRSIAPYILATALLIAFSLTRLPAQTPPAPVLDAIQQGTAAMRAGHAAEAEAHLRTAIRLAPTLPEAHLDLGLILAREGKFDDAAASMRTALALNPTLPSARMFLGIFLSQAGHPDQAEIELKQETADNPSNIEALTWLGMVQLATNHPERAVTAFDRAAELAPDDLNILEYRGRAHRDVARDSFSRMARIDPGNWHVHRVQAELYAEDGRHQEAITEYEAAIKQESRNPDLYEALGEEYRKLNQLDAAQKAFTSELTLGPQNPVAMYELGSIEIERGNNAAGVALLETMLKQRSGEAVAEYYLGRGLAALGKDADAAKWLEKAAADDAAHSEVAKRSLYELSRVYRKLQRPADSASAMAKYNDLRARQEKQSADQIQDWRKLSAAAAQPAPDSNQ